MNKINSLEEFKKEFGYVIDNTWYPRVTKICEIKSKPALYYFYAEAPNFKEATSKKIKAADEGKIIHEIIESFIQRRQIIVPPEYEGIKKAFEDFLKNHSFFSKEDWLEKKTVHFLHRYAGTFDIIGELDGQFSLIDIKTSQSIYEDYRLQTSAYFMALNEEGFFRDEKGRKIPLLKPLEKRYVLRINQKRICEKCGAVMRIRKMGSKIEGGDAFCDHRFGEILGEWELKAFDNVEEDFKAFLGCKTLWEWEYRDYLKEIGYL
ncbi:MAG: hypothetical protein RQ894_00340 [Candidatus Pacebacteria bacterium]|jgi:hypothetical protein|nr:hypothetical protein [Candidatus Paceibacterota bacterium]